MSTLIDKTINGLVRKLPDLIKQFQYRKGPDLYFYKKTIELRRSKPLTDLFEESDRYIELMYATLTAWDMNSRGAKMKYFDGFKNRFSANKERLIQLSSERLETLQKGRIGEVKTRLEQIYTNLHLMESGRKACLKLKSHALHVA